MADILNSAILNLAILDSAILVFPLKLTHTCQDWFPPFAQKTLHSFILTQLDDGSNLEFYHIGLRKLHSFILTQLDDGSHLEFYHVGFRHLVFFSQIHSKTLSLHSDSDSNLFILTQTYSFSLNLMMATILNSAILDSAILVFPLKLPHTCQDWFPSFAQKRLHSHFPPHHLHKIYFTHSFWLNLMMAAI